MPCLVIFVRFHDGRYHGAGDWPPSPARVFQALVAGASQDGTLAEGDKDALRWLESLKGAPAIAAPPMRPGQAFKNFVPNNDRDSVESRKFGNYRDYLAALGKIRTSKDIRPILFDAEAPLVYVWTFDNVPAAHAYARRICAIAKRLYQLGRGVDMAWAWGEILDNGEVEACVAAHGGALHRPSDGASGTMLAVPLKGSLESLIARHEKMRSRFRTLHETKPGKKEPEGRVATGEIFVQPPKPRFRQVAYDSPPARLLFDLVGEMAPWRLDRIVALSECVRDAASQRLKGKLPGQEDKIHNVIVGRCDADEADKAARVRISPLPSIGHQHADHAIRRILLEIPPNCPLRADDLEWAFSGLEAISAKVDAETGELRDQLILAPTAERGMLAHYGGADALPARVWRTITPAALPQAAARRRIDPARRRVEAKSGAERAEEEGKAVSALIQALRHIGMPVRPLAVRVQREPFDAKGARAEAFAPSTRFSRERLWHAEVAFAEAVRGPLILGDGRYLGLGLMAPVRRIEGVFAFAIADGLTDQAEPLGLARALRRAVMARVQEKMGERATLPPFFTGHAANGAPSRSGRHEHLAFVFDAPQKRLLIVAPHIVERREAYKGERENLLMLEGALEDFRELRAGTAGRLSLLPCAVEMEDNRLFARSSRWESLTPYRVTRHAKLSHAAAALETDLLAECRRAGLPRPEIEVAKAFAKPGAGLFGLVTLKYRAAVAGPILLGRDRHFGGGLFVPAG